MHTINGLTENRRLDSTFVKPGRCGRSTLVAAAVFFLSACSQLPSTVSPVEPSPSATSPSKAPHSAQAADPEVRTAQEALAELGYYRGPIDGVDGPKTHAAIANYQADEGILSDGKVTRELVARLTEAQRTTVAEHSAGAAPAGPAYEPGDAYVYSDGHVETVQSTSDRRVEWRDAAGLHWSSERDFTLPTGRSDTASIVSSTHAFSWPLRVGATAAYATKPGDGVAGGATWQCAVETRESIAVPAGTFDSYRIVCRLDGDPLKTTESRTWYYAPAVGHYVRYVDEAATPLNGVTGTRSRDLVSVSLGANGWPSEARTGLEWAVSHALEAEPEGHAVPWESSALAARFVIEPRGQVDVGGSGQCRRFSETRISPDATKRVYPGIACRQSDGHWRLFGLDGLPSEHATS